MPHKNTRSNDSIITVRLGESDREALLDHFLALDGEDRRLRFGAAVADARLREYVAHLDFGRDGLYAVRGDELRVLAAVHVALSPRSAELGLSVLPAHRDGGLGNALFQRAVTFLRNREVREVFVHCLSENGRMLHLARKNGMRTLHSGAESDARLTLAPATVESFISEWLDDQKGDAMLLAAKVP
jgi:GNAT superfamily N-acetyltransferase